MVKILSKIMGDSGDRLAKKFKPWVDEINSLEPELDGAPESHLLAKTEELRENLRDGEDLDELLPEAFSVVREAAKRTLGQRHYDVQLMGGIVLHEGKIAEMKTGEGKTLVATLPVYLNALTGRGVHIITVNDYLAKRDTAWMGPIYHILGLSVACLQHDISYMYDPSWEGAGPGLESMRPITRRGGLQCRHHLRHEQRVRVRLPP